jgi:dienelactone hydrolase
MTLPQLLPGFIAVLGAALALPAARAALVEQVIQVPVAVVDRFGKSIAQDITVTLFFDDAAPRPYPALVLNHGRAVEPIDRAAIGRARYSANAHWLAQLGFLVAVPTRIGYGVTGGEDVEDSGSCSAKRYAPGYEAAARQTLAVLHALRQRADVAPARAVVMGQSYGGTTAIAVAAHNPPGVQAAINFAGGGGGNPKTRPGDPCQPGRLEDLFTDYGKTARLPTLWIYTENDRYIGARLPREWFDAFRAAGGTGQFVRFGPHGEDGHALFTRGPEVWRGTVLKFLREHGYPELPEPTP